MGAEAFLDEFRQKAEGYIDGHGSKRGMASGELGTLAFAFVVMLAISVGVPLVICVIVGRTVAWGPEMAFSLGSSVVLALVGVACFDHNKRLELRYDPFRKNKKLKGLVREMCASDAYRDTVKRAEVADLAEEGLERAQRTNKHLRRVWKVSFFVFVAVLSFGLAWAPQIGSFTLSVYWAAVPLAVFAVFELANCANERRGAFYDFAGTIL